MSVTLRHVVSGDIESLIDLALYAWEPVFSSWRVILGEDIYVLAYPDWRRSQSEAVKDVCTANASTTIVAEREGSVVGFASVVLSTDDGGTRAGDLEMIAVDPNAQRLGIGRRLLEASLEVMRDAGCAYASVWTGGDSGHGPARALYEAGGFTALPVTHYYKALR